jgi:hypothetical protein
MATAKQTSIRLTPEDVTILEEIQRRTGLLGLSDAMRFALRQYARAEGIEHAKPKPLKRPKK